jgi:hypothetical protein
MHLILSTPHSISCIFIADMSILVLYSHGGKKYPTYKKKRRKSNWTGHILRRNCLLKHVTEGKIEGRIEVKGRQGRRRKKLLMTLRKQEVTGNWKRKH